MNRMILIVSSIIICLLFLFAAAEAKLPDDFASAGVQKKAEPGSKKGSVLEIKNVRWGFESPERHGANKPKWRDIEIDAGRVKDVYFCVKPFPPEWLVAHTFLIFEFDEEGPVVTNFNERSKSLVLSIEPIYTAGKTYGKSMTKGPMFIVYQLSSYEDYMLICNIERSKVVFPFRLNLTPELKQKLLINALDAAFTCDFPRYDLFTNNCINNLFELFNTILPDKKHYFKTFFNNKIWNPNVSTPQLCINALKRYSLFGQKIAPIKFTGDISVKPKQFEGRDREIAAAKIIDIKKTAAGLKNIIIENIENGVLNHDNLQTLFYNGATQSLLYFYVPPVFPDEACYKEFKIGPEFINNSKGPDASPYFSRVIDSYTQAVEERLLLEGPDVYDFLKLSLLGAKKSVEDFVRYHELMNK